MLLPCAREAGTPRSRRRFPARRTAARVAPGCPHAHRLQCPGPAAPARGSRQRLRRRRYRLVGGFGAVVARRALGVSRKRCIAFEDGRRPQGFASSAPGVVTHSLSCSTSESTSKSCMRAQSCTVDIRATAHSWQRNPSGESTSAASGQIAKTSLSVMSLVTRACCIAFPPRGAPQLPASTGAHQSWSSRTESYAPVCPNPPAPRSVSVRASTRTS